MLLKNIGTSSSATRSKTASQPVRATDCYLVSADGTRYPVHKTKLQEQSKVLRQARKHTRWTTAGTDALAVIS